jgi:hypothetical protein
MGAMKHRSLLRLGVVLGLAPLPMACATAPQTGGPPSTSGPVVRCHTVLEVRPGGFGGGTSTAVPVQQCEPEMPTPAPPPSGADEQPLGAPNAPSTTTP